jgi:hypothetical protein
LRWFLSLGGVLSVLGNVPTGLNPASFLSRHYVTCSLLGVTNLCNLQKDEVCNVHDSVVIATALGGKSKELQTALFTVVWVGVGCSSALASHV